jgi:mRNA interferase MazF
LTLEVTSAKLPKRSWIKIGQIRTLSVQRLGGKMGRLSPEELQRLVEGLNEIVG